jgi:hypothetical protein
MDTPIGNTTIRGVSGGERHRVTTAEMVSGTKFTCCNLQREKTSKKEYILHRMVLADEHFLRPKSCSSSSIILNIFCLLIHKITIAVS